MKALVTGGGGFLGRHIIEVLRARGDSVRCLARNDYPELRGLGVETVRGDIRDPIAIANACREVDCVFHAAAKPGISMDRGIFDAINRVGTENVLAACRRNGVPRLVYTSSPSVVFAGHDQAGVDETAPHGTEWLQANRAWYSLSKAQAEQAVLSANQGDLRTCALRPHLIWGPGDTHLIPRLIARARAGRLRRVGDGTNLVDTIYVRNAAEAHLLAADALDRNDGALRVGGKAYFLSQGEPVNCWDWIDEILALAGLPPVRKSISLEAARRIGGAFEGLYRLLRLRGEPPMTRFLAAQLARSHWFDISAARRDFAYAPRISTAEGMGDLRKWLATC